jgi:DNA-binding XRE family transcriptional regulator
MQDYFCAMPFNRKLFREDRERYGAREKLAGKIGTTGTTIYNWEMEDVEPGLYLLEKASREMGHAIGRYMDEPPDSSLGFVIPTDIRKIISPEKIEEIASATFWGSYNQEKAAKMTDEELNAMMSRVHERISLYKLQDEIQKELERRKGINKSDAGRSDG